MKLTLEWTEYGLTDSLPNYSLKWFIIKKFLMMQVCISSVFYIKSNEINLIKIVRRSIQVHNRHAYFYQNVHLLVQNIHTNNKFKFKVNKTLEIKYM